MNSQIVEIVGLALWLAPVIVYYVVIPIVSGIRKAAA